MKVKKIKIGMQFFDTIEYKGPLILHTITKKSGSIWHTEYIYKEGLSTVIGYNAYDNDYLLDFYEFLNPVEIDFNNWLKK